MSVGDWIDRQLTCFEPFQRAASVTRIDYDALWDAGVRGIVFDLENTLALYKGDELVPGHRELLVELKERGFALGIVSNSSRTWVTQVSEPLGIPFVGDAGKPRPVAFLRMVACLPVTLQEVAMVGDQRLTDVYGAQRLGLRAVLVDALGNAEPLTSRLQRRFVPPLLRAARRLVRRS